MSIKALLIAEASARIRAYPAETPAACVHVLGKPLVARIAEHLERSGVSEVVVVTDIDERLLREVSGVRFVRPEHEENIWRAAERTFEELESAGVKGVIVLRADHYAEIDWQAVLAHHMHFRNRATRVHCGDAPACDFYLVSAARRNEAASLMRHCLQEPRSAGIRYCAGEHEYVNLLKDCKDLRLLVCDALYGLNAIKPVGKEVRPGMWLHPASRVEREARLVAPVYVGAHARVHGGAVITGGSAIEHHVSVDCGTVIEDSHLQPYTAVGASLDVCHSVVEGDKLFHVERRAGLAAADPKLLSRRRENAAVRAAQAAAALAAFMPTLVLHAARKRRVPAACDSPTRAVHLSSKNEDVAKLAPGLAVMRRYGNE